MSYGGVARETMRIVRDSVHSVPMLMVPGLIVFAVASAADLLFHTAPFGWGEMLEGYFGPEGMYVHMGIMAGMVLTLAGLVAWGATRPGRKRTVRLESPFSAIRESEVPGRRHHKQQWI